MPADYERALHAYKSSADRGEATARIQLGHMYAHGCAPPDDEAAVAAYRRAADAGYAEAAVALSDMIRAGRGGAAGAPEAYYWAKFAERRLRADGELRAHAAASAKAAARSMSAAEITAADRMVDAIMAATPGSGR